MYNIFFYSNNYFIYVYIYLQKLQMLYLKSHYIIVNTRSVYWVKQKYMLSLKDLRFDLINEDNILLLFYLYGNRILNAIALLYRII